MGKDISDKSQSDLTVSVVDIEEGLPRSSKRQRLKSCTNLLQRSLNRRSDNGESPWPKLVRRALYLLSAMVGLATIATIIYHSLLLSLVRRLSPPKASNNGLVEIVNAWVEPGTEIPAPPSWLPNFSRDVTPKAIHSHNDYWRRVPLFDALSLGVTGVEADCHLVDGELYVAHTNSSLRSNRTFRSLYLDPLTSILENQNPGNYLASSSGINGVWDVDPSKGIVLLTDLKTEGFSTLQAVQEQLAPLRANGWLTYWNGSDVVPGPITHVATGNTPFEAVLTSTFSNASYRDVFFDAPLDALSDAYNVSNSLYASTSLMGLLEKEHIPQRGLSKSQVATVQAQIDLAASLGLLSRYWDIPPWPVNRRTNIWKQLEELGIGMLNADEIEEASMWNWSWCNVLGLHLC